MSRTYVLAEVAGERVAFPAAQVDQVIELDLLVPVPRAPGFVAGITTLRSKMLTVIDVARAVGACPSPSPSRLALTADRGGCSFAFLVDSVETVASTLAEVAPVEVRLTGRWEHYSAGVVDTPSGRALVVDLDLLTQEKQPHEEAA